MPIPDYRTVPIEIGQVWMSATRGTIFMVVNSQFPTGNSESEAFVFQAPSPVGPPRPVSFVALYQRTFGGLLPGDFFRFNPFEHQSSGEVAYAYKLANSPKEFFEKMFFGVEEENEIKVL